MAKLPDVRALGARRAGRAVPRVAAERDPTQVARAQAQQAGGLVEAGNLLTQAGQRIQTRNDALGVLRSTRNFRDLGTQEAQRVLAEGDLSDPETTMAFGAFLNELESEAFGAHRGGADSRATLNQQLGNLKFGLMDQISGAATNAQQKAISSELDGTLNQFALQVRSNPGQFINIANEFGNIIDAQPLGAETKLSLKRNALSRLTETAVDQLVMSGEIEEATKLISDPGVARALGEERQRSIFNRLGNRVRPTRVLTDQETAAIGFPEGVIVQQGGDGSLDVVFKPTQDTGLREQKISDLIERGVDEERAQDIVDGNIKIEIVPTTGRVRETNIVSGEAREVPLDPVTAEAMETGRAGRTLFQIAQTGAIAGIAPATVDIFGRTIGQLPGMPVNEEVIGNRQEVQVAQNELIRALSINPRFPVGEINRIREEIKIAPTVLDSTPALLARMAGIDRGLRIRLANEESAANNVNLPDEARGNASQSARDIRNFLRRLGVPEDINPNVPGELPPGSIRIGVTANGKEIWQTPAGDRLKEQ